ncbi:hypothetical protein O3M35_002983 [Rhynocoris fuscipes]|uniref:Uncharacterized protein n=1 Tax=Rhynocoris fuscipes TaxID=488301 RepID=A0AAW1CLF7_9HEMI
MNVKTRPIDFESKMAPTISELADRRRPTFSLEEHLQRSLRLSSQNDPLRCTQSNRTANKSCLLNKTAVCAVMGLVVEQELREGDSPTLASSNSHLYRDVQRSRRHTCVSRKEDLIDLTLRTMVLLKRNQLLQKKLTALQKETRAFVMSTLKEQQQQQHQQQHQQQQQMQQLNTTVIDQTADRP